MQTFIESGVLADLRKGSMETFAENLAEAATEKLGEDVSVFATHRDHAFGTAGDRVVKLTWTRTVDGTEIHVEDAEVPVITGETVDKFVAKKLRETVDSLMGGDLEISRTQLRAVVGHILPDGHYWASDGIKIAEDVLAEKPQWLAVYEDEDGRKAIRKAVHGMLGETEGMVPRTPYSRIPEKRLVEFSTEIRESLTRISELLSGLPDQLKDLEFSEDEAEDIELAAARDSIAEESSTLERAVVVALRFLGEEDLPQAAKFHDILAERLKPMLVVGRFLARLGSDTQNSGENQDASSP